jgi:hypothetical protein
VTATRALVLASLVAAASSASAKPPAAASSASAKPPAAASSASAKPSAAPLAPLALLPSVSRVKIVSHGTAFAIIEDVNLPRGDWKGEALRFHVALGAPGPRAIDARLVPVADGALEAPDDDPGEPLAVERVPRRPSNAYALIGRETMAGIVVNVRPEAMRRALAPGNMAALRIRSVVDATEPDASGASSVLVRLGTTRSTPLTLGRIVVTSAAPARPIVRAEARLCGPEADPYPLAVGIVPKPRVASAPDDGAPAPIAPVLAVRHASDDLCVRFWHAR